MATICLSHLVAVHFHLNFIDKMKKKIHVYNTRAALYGTKFDPKQKKKLERFSKDLIELFRKNDRKKIPIFKINRLLFELTGKNFNRNLKKQPKTKN